MANDQVNKSKKDKKKQNKKNMSAIFSISSPLFIGTQWVSIARDRNASNAHSGFADAR